jgi:hypothetical protein
VIGVFATAGSSANAADTTFEQLFEDASFNVNLRYRFEYVDQDAFANDARASTLRTRLSFQSGRFQRLSFLVEADDIRDIGWDDYNAGAGNTPSKVDYPVVADPKGTEINQAYIDYHGTANTRVRLGRQRILLDNQRFVGAVGWRQNEQTYDALSVSHGAGPVNLFYAYVDTVNLIFGERVTAGKHRQDGTHLLNLSGTVGGIGQLTGYAYEIDNETQPSHSTRTLGLRLHGVRPAGDVSITYAAEYARQRDSGDNPVSFTASYVHVEAGFGGADWHVGAGYEVLGGDRGRTGRMFRTPLATLHAFNGRTDKFLATPQAGLEDVYLKAHTNLQGTQLEARYHDFSAQDSGANFGREVSLAAGRSLGRHLRADLIVADFSGSGGFDDTRKIWLMLGASF